MAKQIYFTLGSPAGVAACEIERGRMRLLSPSCGKLDEVVDNLVEMIKNGDEREILELDPWVPTVLRQFSKEVGGQLEKEARRVSSRSTRNLEEKGDQGVQSIAAVAGDLDGSEKNKPTTNVVEMGGESRRKKAPLELLAA